MAERRRIRWAPAAVLDLDEIVDYVAAHDGPPAAARLYEKLTSRSRALRNHPARCRIVPELRALGILEYREMILAPYRLFFRLVRNEVRIVALLDGRRDLEETLIRRLMR